MTAAIAMGSANPARRPATGRGVTARSAPKRQVVRRSSARSSQWGSRALTIAVLFVVSAVTIPKAHALLQAWSIPFTIAEDVRELAKEIHLYKVGCGHPPPTASQLAKGVRTAKTTPWGHQYSLTVGSRDTLWMCLGQIPKGLKNGIESRLKDQKNVVMEHDGMLYVMW